MKIREITAQTILYLFIILSGAQVGAAVYEVFVITPLWSRSPPETVINWNPVAAFAINPGLYWGKFTPLYTLCALLMFVAAWFMPKARRNLMLIGGVSGLLCFLATIFFFIPILMKTIVTRGAGLSGDEITRLVNLWVNWNWFRLIGVVVGWLAAIRALSLPLPIGSTVENESLESSGNKSLFEIEARESL